MTVTSSHSAFHGASFREGTQVAWFVARQMRVGLRIAEVLIATNCRSCFFPAFVVGAQDVAAYAAVNR